MDRFKKLAAFVVIAYILFVAFIAIGAVTSSFKDVSSGADAGYVLDAGAVDAGEQ